MGIAINQNMIRCRRRTEGTAQVSPGGHMEAGRYSRQNPIPKKTRVRPTKIGR